MAQIIALLMLGGMFLASSIIPTLGISTHQRCEAVFEDVSVTLGNDAKVSKNACKNALKNNKEIQEVVCLNSTTLGNIVINWGDEMLAELPIECDESMGEGVAVTETGTLTAIVEETLELNDEATYHLNLTTPSGQTIDIVTPTTPPGLFSDFAPGDDVKVRGFKNQNAIIANEENIQFVKGGGGGSGGGGSKGGGGKGGGGNQSMKALVALANFSGNPINCTQAEVDELVFSETSGISTSHFYDIASLSNAPLSGDVVGPVDIPADGSSCGYMTWGNQVDTALNDAGIKTSGYNRTVYVFPSEAVSTCNGLGGAAEQPGEKVWVLDCDYNMIYAHELGHTLNFAHAGTQSWSYGDQSDFMSINMNLPNAPHRVGAGWIDSSAIVENPGVGTYTLGVLEDHNSPHPRILRFSNAHRSLSYRPTEGWLTNMPTAYRERLNVHSDNLHLGGVTIFYDSLIDGESYAIPDGSGLVATQLSHDANSVTISLDEQCVENAPTLTIEPELQGSSSGETLSYTLTITSENSPQCASKNFAVTEVYDSGLSGTLSPTSLTLASGETGTANITVTPDAGIAEAIYAFTMSSDGGSESASYVHDITPPNKPTLHVVKIGNKWRIQSNNVDNIGVDYFILYKDGEEIAQIENFTNYFEKGKGGTYYSIAVDFAGNQSEPSDPVSTK